LTSDNERDSRIKECLGKLRVATFTEIKECTGFSEGKVNRGLKQLYKRREILHLGNFYALPKYEKELNMKSLKSLGGPTEMKMLLESAGISTVQEQGFPNHVEVDFPIANLNFNGSFEYHPANSLEDSLEFLKHIPIKIRHQSNMPLTIDEIYLKRKVGPFWGIYKKVKAFLYNDLSSKDEETLKVEESLPYPIGPKELVILHVPINSVLDFGRIFEGDDVYIVVKYPFGFASKSKPFSSFNFEYFIRAIDGEIMWHFAEKLLESFVSKGCGSKEYIDYVDQIAGNWKWWRIFSLLRHARYVADTKTNRLGLSKELVNEIITADIEYSSLIWKAAWQEKIDISSDSRFGSTRILKAVTEGKIYVEIIVGVKPLASPRFHMYVVFKPESTLLKDSQFYKERRLSLIGMFDEFLNTLLVKPRSYKGKRGELSFDNVVELGVRHFDRFPSCRVFWGVASTTETIPASWEESIRMIKSAKCRKTPSGRAI
jgi:hypothetical protein